MDRQKYIDEVNRQLNDERYYKKVEKEQHNLTKLKIEECVNEIQENNVSITKQFDMFPSTIRTPQFYILPKTHKSYDEKLPLGYPGRLIVSACSSSTENIAKYLDFILNPYMQTLPSYIKDTTDFINKVRNLKLNKDTYIVTLDVSSLYTNIPHNEGIESCIYFLQKDKGNNNIKANDIRKLLNIVLHNNCFDFNDQSYLQTMGTAMGSPMAPSYASLVMGRLEEQFLNST
ncbi:uncharacterized protein LOC132719850 [Ruditapes philippinarum]|uniref:uncharacterized protein LOC132719850 n=1 Tax=Ruditapes philippinarum TaxID=129788 RepID=UPI00295BF5BF|nr:uncharacterized protein LOC132719850 [Ruditapes philippinarum]